MDNPYRDDGYSQPSGHDNGYPSQHTDMYGYTTDFVQPAASYLQYPTYPGKQMNPNGYYDNGQVMYPVYYDPTNSTNDLNGPHPHTDTTTTNESPYQAVPYANSVDNNAYEYGQVHTDMNHHGNTSANNQEIVSQDTCADQSPAESQASTSRSSSDDGAVEGGEDQEDGDSDSMTIAGPQASANSHHLAPATPASLHDQPPNSILNMRLDSIYYRTMDVENINLDDVDLDLLESDNLDLDNSDSEDGDESQSESEGLEKTMSTVAESQTINTYQHPVPATPACLHEQPPNSILNMRLDSIYYRTMDVENINLDEVNVDLLESDDIDLDNLGSPDNSQTEPTSPSKVVPEDSIRLTTQQESSSQSTSINDELTDDDTNDEYSNTASPASVSEASPNFEHSSTASPESLLDQPVNSILNMRLDSIYYRTMDVENMNLDEVDVDLLESDDIDLDNLGSPANHQTETRAPPKERSQCDVQKSSECQPAGSNDEHSSTPSPTSVHDQPPNSILNMRLDSIYYRTMDVENMNLDQVDVDLLESDNLDLDNLASVDNRQSEKNSEDPSQVTWAVPEVPRVRSTTSQPSSKGALPILDSEDKEYLDLDTMTKVKPQSDFLTTSMYDPYEPCSSYDAQGYRDKEHLDMDTVQEVEPQAINYDHHSSTPSPASLLDQPPNSILNMRLDSIYYRTMDVENISLDDIDVDLLDSDNLDLDDLSDSDSNYEPDSDLEKLQPKRKSSMARKPMKSLKRPCPVPLKKSDLDENDDTSSSQRTIREYRKKPKYLKKECANCGTKETSNWRMNKEMKIECNSCYLYEKLKGVKRPESLWKNPIRNRNDGSAPSSPMKPCTEVQPYQKVKGLAKALSGGCSNCGAQETSRWRVNKNMEKECNSCFLYEKLKGVKRPKSFWNEKIVKREGKTEKEEQKKREERRQLRERPCMICKTVCRSMLNPPLCKPCRRDTSTICLTCDDCGSTGAPLATFQQIKGKAICKKCYYHSHTRIKRRQQKEDEDTEESEESDEEQEPPTKKAKSTPSTPAPNLTSCRKCGSTGPKLHISHDKMSATCKKCYMVEYRERKKLEKPPKVIEEKICHACGESGVKMDRFDPVTKKRTCKKCYNKDRTYRKYWKTTTTTTESRKCSQCQITTKIASVDRVTGFVKCKKCYLSEEKRRDPILKANDSNENKVGVPVKAKTVKTNTVKTTKTVAPKAVENKKLKTKKVEKVKEPTGYVEPGKPWRKMKLPSAKPEDSKQSSKKNKKDDDDYTPQNANYYGFDDEDDEFC